MENHKPDKASRARRVCKVVESKDSISNLLINSRRQSSQLLTLYASDFLKKITTRFTAHTKLIVAPSLRQKNYISKVELDPGEKSVTELEVDSANHID